MLGEKVVAYVTHVLSDKRTKLAHFIVLGRHPQMFGLEVGIHGDVALKTLFAYRALETHLRFEFLLTNSDRRG